MLGMTSDEHPEITWEQADLNTWEPDITPDLIYSNAAFQRTPDHNILLPKLINTVKGNRVFAIQLPNNWNEPSHESVCEIARKPQWQGRPEP